MKSFSDIVTFPGKPEHAERLQSGRNNVDDNIADSKRDRLMSFVFLNCCQDMMLKISAGYRRSYVRTDLRTCVYAG